MKFKLDEVIEVNPREQLKKGETYRKIEMADLDPFVRKPQNIKKDIFKSGSKFRNDDTLLARITPCLENGKTAFINILEDGEVAFGSTEFLVLRAKKNKIEPKYLYYISISDEFRNVAIKSMTGSSGRQRVQKESILEYELEIPDMDIQKNVAKFLDNLDSKIEINNKIIKNLEHSAEAIFKHWFVDFEFPDENGNPYKCSGGKMVESEFGPIPEGWEVKSLDEIADYKNGLAMQKFKPRDGKMLNVIKIRELNQGRFDDKSEYCRANIPEEVIIENGDVIFSWSGTLMLKLWFGGKGGLNQHLFKVTSEKYEKWFYFFWTKFYLKNFINIAESKATTMGHIKRSHLKEALVLIPKTAQLENFNKFFRNIFFMINNCGLQNRKLEELRDTLLPKLLSGEIEVPME